MIQRQWPRHWPSWMCAVIGSLDLLSQLDNFLQHDADEGESGEEESGEGDEMLAAELEGLHLDEDQAKEVLAILQSRRKRTWKGKKL